MGLKQDLKKPLDAGFKRNLLIIGGAIGVSVLVIVAMMMFASNDQRKSSAQETELTRVMPAENKDNDHEISPAMRERLAKVQEEEAIAAYREGRSYIAENTLGPGERVQQEQRQPVAAEQPGPGESGYAQYTTRPRQITQQDTLNAQRDLISRGLELQLQQIAYVFEPAQSATVQIKPIESAENQGNSQRTANNGGTGARGAQNTPPVIFPGLQIAPARLESPINTDKSRFVSATITAGPLQGAYLIGEAAPMTLSGDVEDVGVQMTQMRFKNQLYPIDAILLNEQTASDMMEADIDRHIISKQVLPVIMAGLSGLSTFFTAQGQTGVRYSPSPGLNENIIVDQPKASREEAKQQGIGDAIGALVDNGNQQVNRMQQRPNTATVDAYTPVGVLFRQPVYAKTAQ